MHVGFWWGNPKEGNHLEDLRVDGDNTKVDIQEVEWGHGLK